jgi:hypothetical protein
MFLLLADFLWWIWPLMLGPAIEQALKHPKHLFCQALLSLPFLWMGWLVFPLSISYLSTASF